LTFEAEKDAAEDEAINEPVEEDEEDTPFVYDRALYEGADEDDDIDFD
jgi:hypothetical protein